MRDGLPDDKIDIAKEADELVVFLDRLLDGFGYRDDSGEIKIWSKEEIDAEAIRLGMNHPSSLMDREMEEMLPTFQNYDFEVGFLEWLDERLWHEYALSHDGEVIGWNIGITSGGPSVFLRLEPFSGKCIFWHSWGVHVFESGRFESRKRVEFFGPLAESVSDRITEIFSEVIRG